MSTFVTYSTISSPEISHFGFIPIDSHEHLIVITGHSRIQIWHHMTNVMEDESEFELLIGLRTL